MKKFNPPKGIEKYFRKVFYGKFANWPKTFWFNKFIQGKAENRIRAKAKSGDTLNVIFFVLNIGMWKYESLFKLLMADEQFNPIIIPYPLIWESEDTLKRNERGIIEYCERMGFPYKIGYNILSKTYIPADELNADFVSYSQPYNNCPDFWKVEKFYNTALIFNYPYGLPIDNNSHFVNLLTENVSWRLFHTTKSSELTYKKNKVTKGKNFLWVGSTIYDKLIESRLSENIWKQADPAIKRVIWAPHHTIEDTDDLPFSTFLIFSEEMLKIAKEYSGRIQFVFKPHPMLRGRLISKWGKEKVDDYYRQWEEMENTVVCNGDYTWIFKTSNAMIHDCAGFTMEYLFTGKPVLFLAKQDIKPYVAEFSYSCYEQHYKARTKDEIRSFLDNVVLNGNDSMKDSREAFYNNFLLPPNGGTAGMNMYSEFKKVL